MSVKGKVTPKAPYAECDGCPLYNRSFAATTGPPQARTAVVSRSPGYYEGLNGKSFAGPSGKVLDHLLQLHGTSRDDVLATNAVLCQSDGTEQGFAKALMHCQPRLEHEIKDCDTVIACGREAAWTVAGESNISANRGYVHERVSQQSGKTQRVIITNNPAVVLRDDHTFPELVRDFRLALDPLPVPKLPKVKWIDDLEEANDVAEKVLDEITQLTKNGERIIIASDIEVSRDSAKAPSHTGRLSCVGFSIRPERSVVFGSSVCGRLGWRVQYLNEIYGFQAESASYLWHNGKYDVKVLRQHGIPARVDEDTMLLSWCLDERPGDPESGAGGHALEWLLKDEMGWPKYEPTSVRHFKKDGILVYPNGARELYEYNGLDTAGSLALFEILKHRAINDKVWEKPYKSLLNRLSEALTRIELEGNLFDVERACDLLEHEVWPKLDAQREKMRKIAQKPALNPNSPKQLETLLYDEWGIKHNLMRPKIERQGKRSTDKWVRETL